MNRTFLIIFFLLFILINKSHAQTKMEYKGITIYDFKNVSYDKYVYKDSLDAIAEWSSPIKGRRLNELTSKELDEIVKRAKKYKCVVLYLSLERKEVFDKNPDYVYVLGFKRKK